MKITDFTNIASTVSAVLTILLGVMSQVLGCSMKAEAAATCTAEWLPPQYAVYAALFFAAATLGLKIVRPGGVPASLFGSTAVVVAESKSGPGTVTPAQVASK
jgi:hypothetical protein